MYIHIVVVTRFKTFRMYKEHEIDDFLISDIFIRNKYVCTHLCYVGGKNEFPVALVGKKILLDFNVKRFFFSVLLRVLGNVIVFVFIFFFFF
jgi:hypothetical protein